MTLEHIVTLSNIAFAYQGIVNSIDEKLNNEGDKTSDESLWVTWKHPGCESMIQSIVVDELDDKLRLNASRKGGKSSESASRVGDKECASDPPSGRLPANIKVDFVFKDIVFSFRPLGTSDGVCPMFVWLHTTDVAYMLLGGGGASAV